MTDRITIYGHTIVEDEAAIGDGTKVCSFCYIEKGATIGKGCTIKNGVYVWRGVHLGDRVFVGPNATFTNDKHPKAGNAEWTLTETWVGDDASIGANATILPGVRIGAGAIIGAGAVVTHDVGPGEVVAGNPARLIGSAK